MGALYVVATPIGNLEDITFRAVRVLGEVALIAAEDTRTTRKLLNYYKIKTPLTSYYEHNERAKVPFILNVLKDKDVALVSEAGMPGISDPGHALVKSAVETGVRVVPIPGPSVVTAALSVSGLGCDQFVFLGFLPRRKKERRDLLLSVSSEPRTLVFLEAPHRLRDSIRDMAEVLKDRQVVVCRELTKVHEEIYRGALSSAGEHFDVPRGEFTLVVEGAALQKDTQTVITESDLLELAMRFRREGLTSREAMSRMRSLGATSREEAYKAWVKAEGR